MPHRGGAFLIHALSGAQDPLALLPRIVDQALVLIPGAEGSVVDLMHEDRLVVACGAGTLRDSVGTSFSTDRSLAGLSIRTGQIQRSDDTEMDRRVDRGACRTLSTRSMLCMPLLPPGGGPLGVLTVASSRPSSFSERDVQVLSKLAGFIATSVATAYEFAHMMEAHRAGRPTADQAEDGADPTEHLVARFIANVMQPELFKRADMRQTIEGVLGDGAFEMLYQPVFDLSDRSIVAAEALARFLGTPYRPPNEWFADAESVGLGLQLELAAARAALAPIPFLPDGVRMAINVGPRAIESAELTDIIDSAGPHRVILELTEHLKVEDYPSLKHRLDDLRRAGTLLAIDDTGSGISSLTHVLKLAPDIIKLDREITSGIDIDPVRRALTAALRAFVGETGAAIIAEGIETDGELEVVQTLGVPYGQGFGLARPGPAIDLRGHEPSYIDVPRRSMRCGGPWKPA